ncbi:MAG: threonylcarbamoyl-AMP synthase [Nitrospirae bacterium]|nr:threonylcarbamoyl-AMP synthase [Nitrospirota bacterium]
MRLKLSETPEAVIFETALKYLKSGKIIAYPTETFYGLGAAYDNNEALQRLWEIKRRSSGKPFPLIAADVNQLGVLASEIEPEALALIGKYWPGPLTILFNAKQGLSQFITGKEGKVAVRVPGSSAALRLARYVMFPVTATSANISNEPPASDAQTVIDCFGDAVDMIIDGGSTRGGRPSTIVEVVNGHISVIRHGAVNWPEFPAYMNKVQGL